MRDLKLMYRDIITMADISEVPYSEKKIEEALDIFQDGFTKGSVQFKATTKPREKRGINFRYTICASEPHPQDIAQKAGLLSADGVENKLLEQVRQNHPLRRVAADFDAKHGLVKIWQYVEQPFLLNDIFKLTEIPESVQTYKDFFAKFHLESPPIIGVDFHRHSMNLYFMVNHPDQRKTDFVKSILRNQQFDLPSSLISIYCTKALIIAVTFRWDSDRMERMCFYVTGFHPHNIPSLHPLLTHLAQKAPFVNDERRFQVSWSFGQRGQYMKMDVDYTGDLSI